MFKKINTVLTVLDMFEYEKQLTKHHQYMQHTEKQAKAQEIVRNHVGFSMGAALVPFPGADLLAVSAVQLNMLRQLAKLYQIGFVDALGRNVISAVVGAGAARLGASLVKLIPGVGTLIGEVSMPILSGASTYALGRVIAAHFHGGGTLENLDLAQARGGYASAMEEGKKVAGDLEKTPVQPIDDPLEKIKKLSDMRDMGIISEEEFKQMKEKLLAQV